MKRRRLLTVILFATMAFSTAIASPNANEEKSDANPFSALIDWGKDTWNTVKDAATGIVEDIGDAINSATSKIPVGTWEFKNGSYSTVMRRCPPGIPRRPAAATAHR